MNCHARLYRGLLVLYPRAFRREYAPDLVQAFVDLARNRGLASTWTRCWIDLAVTAPRYHLEALVHRHVSSSALTALTFVVALAGFAGLLLGGVAAVPVLAAAVILALSQRTALAKALVVSPHERGTRLRVAGAIAAVCVATVGSWLYHVDRYDEIGSTTVLLHNAVGVFSLLGAAGCGLAGLVTRTEMPNAARDR
jgi:hypothetical protein